MSVEADFGLSGWVGQLTGADVAWNISWPGVIDDTRYVGVSFYSDFVDSKLERISEWFSEDDKENPFVGEPIRATETLGGNQTGVGVPFRFAVVVIPAH